MPDLGPVRARAWSLFLSPSPPQRRRVAAAAAERAQPSVRVFSTFNDAHVARALGIAAEFFRIADAASPEQALTAVLDAFEALRDTENPDLLDYALMVFITHHPRGAALTHSIPPLTLRNPELVAPSRLSNRAGSVRKSMSFARSLGVAGAAGLEAATFGGGADPSDGLEWYREDPFANEHHAHWHVVYPTRGIPNPANPSQVVFKDRQGEIFFYMHQQMLARYDAERLALGLPRVAPLANYQTPVTVGYNPGEILLEQGFGPRAPNVGMVDISGDPTTLPPTPPYRVSEHETRRDNLKDAISARAYTVVNPPVPMTDVSRLGSTVEANGAGIGAITTGATRLHYGSLHNNGHGTLSAASTGGPGVMTSTATAIRDPVFYEWHKHIDDFYAVWQDGGALQTFADRPPVRMRKAFDPGPGFASSPDILFVFEDQLPATALANLDAWAEESFGGGQWDTDFNGAPSVSDHLETAMVGRQLTLADRVTTVPIDHLTHRPFVCVCRVENLSSRPVAITMRIFIAPVIETGGRLASDDRRVWIEMDKFVVRLAAGQKKVTARRGAQSSVIKKPGLMRPETLKEMGVEFDAPQLSSMTGAGLPPTLAARLQPFIGRVVGVSVIAALFSEAEWNIVAPLLGQFARVVPSDQPQRPAQNDTVDNIEQQEASNYCTCGWPYNLLVPRGTPSGMRFRMAVFCSDWQIDQVGGDESCGSLSFCGARDRYPDRRPMGYPFNARFADPIADVIMANASMAFRDFTIRRTADVAADD